MYTLYITVLGAIFGAARAEEPSLITDRPDIAESSRAVGRGVVQLEQGVSLEGGPRVGFPSLTRVGVGGGVELRVETPILAVQPGGVAFDGLAVGSKWALPLEQQEVGLLTHLDFGPDGALRPVAKLAYDVGLPLGLELGLNGGGTFAGAGLEGPVGLWAAALGRSVTDSLRLYGEASGEHGAGAHAVRLDAGGALLLSPDVQLDASGLVGVLGGGWAVGLGLSVRWD